jgi:hypothetical protein
VAVCEALQRSSQQPDASLAGVAQGRPGIVSESHQLDDIECIGLFDGLAYRGDVLSNDVRPPSGEVEQRLPRTQTGNRRVHASEGCLDALIIRRYHPP